MPLPLPPTILLAMASLEIVSTRILKLRERSIHAPFLLLGLLLAAGALLFERISQTAIFEGDVTTVWTNDMLAIAEQWIVLSFGVLIGLSSWDMSANRQAKQRECGYFLFLLAGLMFVARSNDFLTLGLSVEIVALSLRGLTLRSFHQAEAQRKADDNRLWWLSSAFLWYGIALMANATGTTQFNLTRLVLVDAYAPGGDQSAIGASSKMILLAAGLITISQLARMGIVPFHFGLGIHSAGQRLKVTGLLILAQQLAGAVVLTRLFTWVFAGFDRSLNTLMMAIVLASFVLSSVMSFRARAPGGRSLPQWLGGLALLQGGWLGIGFMIAASESGHPPLPAGAIQPIYETLAVLILTQLAGLLSYGGLFWIFDSLARKDRGVEFIEDLKGLGRDSPLTAFSLTVALASIVGIPWTAGFWVRWLTLLAGHNLHTKSTSPIYLPDSGIRLLMLVGIVATLSAATIAVRLVREVYLEAPHMRTIPAGIRGSFLASIIAAAVTIVLGFAPQLLLAPLASIQPPQRMASENKPTGLGSTPLGMK